MTESVKEFLDGVFNCMHMEVEIELEYNEEEETLDVELKGDDMGVLIGKRGQTLDSLQYLASLVANKESEKYIRVKMDTENYRKRRKTTLENLAKNIAYKVKRTRKPVTLEPMNPYERRIIHTAVQNIEGVVSNSFGEGANRRVVISVEGAEVRPPRNNDRRRNSNNRQRKAHPNNNVQSAPAREPKKDSDIPLYGKIN